MAQICIRLPSNDKKRIDQVVAEGNYQNRSDFLRDAIRSLLREVEAKTDG